MGQYSTNIDFLSIIVNSGNKADIIAADIENRQLSDAISAWKERSQGDKGRNGCRLECLIPVDEAGLCIRIAFNKLVEAFSCNDVHGELALCLRIMAFTCILYVIAHYFASHAKKRARNDCAWNLAAAERRASAAPLAGVCRVEDAEERQVPGNVRTADRWSAEDFGCQERLEVGGRRVTSRPARFAG